MTSDPQTTVSGRRPVVQGGSGVNLAVKTPRTAPIEIHQESEPNRLLERHIGSHLLPSVERLDHSRLHVLLGRPLSRSPFESHPEPEICFVVRNELLVETDGPSVVLAPGDVLVVPSGVYHLPVSTAAFTVTVWLCPSPRRLCSAVSEIYPDGNWRALDTIDLSGVTFGWEYLTAVIEECRGQPAGWVSMCKSHLRMLLARTGAAIARGGVNGVVATDRATIAAVQARDFIYERYNVGIGPSDVARHVCMTPDCLAALYKSVWHEAIGTTLTAARIESSERKLSDTDKTISEIAFEVGYSSLSHFSRVFRIREGMSPTQYREARGRRIHERREVIAPPRPVETSLCERLVARVLKLVENLKQPGLCVVNRWNFLAQNGTSGYPRVYFVIQNQLLVRIGAATLALGPGNGLVLRSGAGCSLQAGGPDVIAMELSPRPDHMFVSAWRIGKGKRLLEQRHLSDFAAGLDILDGLIADHEGRRAYWFQSCKSSLERLLILTGRLLSEPWTRLLSNSGHAARVVAMARRFIESNYMRRVTLDAVAHHVSVSSNHLNNIYRSYFGSTVKQSLVELRISRARHLLTASEMSISEIATEVGLESPFYFSRLFRSRSGMSPTDYRSRYQEIRGRTLFPAPVSTLDRAEQDTPDEVFLQEGV